MNTYKMFTEVRVCSLIEFESNKDFSTDELERIAKDVLLENKTTVGENSITFLPSLTSDMSVEIHKNDKIIKESDE